VEQLRKMDGTRRGLGWLGDQKERSGSVFFYGVFETFAPSNWVHT